MDAPQISKIAWPGVLVLVTAIYGYWAASRELVSSRPAAPGQHDVPDPVPTPGVRTVHSRMWEDPVATAYRHWKTLPSHERASKLHAVTDSDELKERVKNGAEKARASAHASAGQKSCDTSDEACEALITLLFGSGPDGTTETMRGDMKTHFRDLVDREGWETTCLPVFVPGGPYAEDHERRKRARYAVVTALTESGYHLELSRRMSYVVARVYVRVLRGWQEREIVVPVKLYRGKSNRQVLVFWINESEVGLRPLLSLHRIMNEVFSDICRPEQLKVKIIGPASSGMLAEMAEDVRDLEKYTGVAITHYCDRVVKKANQLNPLLVRPELIEDIELVADNIVSLAHARAEQQRHTREPCKICRAAEALQADARLILLETTDRRQSRMHGDWTVPWPKSHVTDAVIAQYRARLTSHVQQIKAALMTDAIEDSDADYDRINHWSIVSYRPIQPIKGYSPLWGASDTSGLVPIFSSRATAALGDEDSELRTFSSPSLFRLFRVIGTDGQLARGLKKELERRGALSGRVVLITEYDTAYARGIETEFIDALQGKDGEKGAAKDRLSVYRVLRGIDGELPGDDVDEKPSTPPDNGISSSSAYSEASERLPEGRSQYDYLHRLRQKLARVDETGNAITAVGVVGSDTYDKLLVLRALKPHFPDCIFFTTDLDAIYVHPDERRQTRNLIVASHFGLSLNETLQRSTPPFRDSYQTATFLATRLALHQDMAFSDADERRQWKEVAGHFMQNRSLKPVIRIVGRDRTRQLSSFDDKAVEKLIHRSEPHDARGRHALFWGLALLGLLGAVVVSVNRELYAQSALLSTNGFSSLLSKTGLDEKQTRGWRRILNTVFFVLLGCGLLLIVSLSLSGQFGYQAASPLGGYNTWLRNMLFAVAGIFAVITLFYLVDQYLKTVSAGTQTTWNLLHRMWGTFQMTHLLNGAGFAAVLLYGGALFVYGMPYGAGGGIIAIAVGMIAFWHYRFYSVEEKDSAASFSGNPILERDPKRVVYWMTWGVAVLTIIAVLQSWLARPPQGWRPSSTSRYGFPRFSDDWALWYAFGAVGLLLASLLYLHLWCREFCRYVPTRPDAESNDDKTQDDDERTRSDDQAIQAVEDERDRLWFVGKVTSVSNRLAPVLMVLLLVLVFAYHPVISPVPMPTGLLVLVTLALAVLVGSILMLRWQFNTERSQVLGRLQEELWDLREHDLESTDQTGSGELAGSSEPEVKQIVYAGHETGDGIHGQAVAERKHEAATDRHQERQLARRLRLLKEQIGALSEGVFRPWSQSPVGWVLGGSATIALVDGWIRWWTANM